LVSCNTGGTLSPLGEYTLIDPEHRLSGYFVEYESCSIRIYGTFYMPCYKRAIFADNHFLWN